MLLRTASVFLVMLSAVGCGSDSGDGAAGSGGVAGAGGSSSGGTGATAGSAGSGGSVSSGGSAGNAGAAGSAGAGGTSASGGSGGSGTGGAPPTCTLKASGAVTVTQDGQIVENLRITSNSGNAITVNGHKKVVIRNVEILHKGGPGIHISNSDDIVIENVSIEHTGAPTSGKNPSDNLNNIQCYQSARPRVTNARLTRGSSGVYLVQCPDSTLKQLEGHDFRGPFPRGQLVQWDKSDNGLLEDFSVINPPSSWPEDNVNVFQSKNVTVRRGMIDGNNSPSGVGVIFDGGPSTGLVEDVDAIRMGNGCFSDYDGGPGVVFRRTRCRENICGDQGRGKPLSNALMWAGHTSHTDLKIEQSEYFKACNAGNLVWPQSSFSVVDLKEKDFSLRAPIQHKFCWQ